MQDKKLRLKFPMETDELERILEPYDAVKSMDNILKEMMARRMYPSAIELLDHIRPTIPELYDKYHDAIQHLMHSTDWNEPARPIERIEGYE